MPEFEPAVLTSFPDEDATDHLIDVFNEWYVGEKYLDNIRYLGIPNYRYNFGGGREFKTRGSYDVKFQDADGYFYSRNGSGELEKLDKDYQVVERTDFAIGGDFPYLELLGNGYIVDGRLGNDTTVYYFIDTETMQYVTNEPDGEGTPFTLETTANHPGIAYDPETDSMYYHGSNNTTRTGLTETLGRLDFSGAPDGTPQVEWEIDLTESRGYLGEDIYDIFLYDGDLWSYGPGVILRFNTETGRIVGRDNFTDQLPVEYKFPNGVFTEDEEIQVTPDGNLHVLSKRAPGSVGYNESSSSEENPGVFDQNRHITYDLDEQDLVRNRATYENVEGVDLVSNQKQNVDSDPEIEDLDLKSRYNKSDLFNQEPWAGVPDNIIDLFVTPYGYLYVIASDLLPRIEFYSFNDTLRWRVYSGLFEYTGSKYTFEDGFAFNHREYAEFIEVDQAYPQYEYYPSLWENPPSVSDEAISVTPTAINYQASVIPEYVKDPATQADVIDEITEPGDYEIDEISNQLREEIHNAPEYDDRRLYQVIEDENFDKGEPLSPYLDYVIVDNDDGTWDQWFSTGAISFSIRGFTAGSDQRRSDSFTFNKASNVALLNEGTVTLTNSETVSVSVSTQTEITEARAVGTADSVQPLVGIISENDTDPLHTQSNSVLATASAEAKEASLTGDYIANVQLTSVTATDIGAGSTAYSATLGNPTLITPDVITKATQTESEGVLRPVNPRVVADIIGEPDEYWRKRALSTGEVTEVEQIHD